mmetsp:Transcript_7591/g.22222  ORF Transcript_7591/g.22222 Transcript_7591/m.22222 type:complete len:95 (+) Transcript_7591:981-1265(+)
MIRLMSPPLLRYQTSSMASARLFLFSYTCIFKHARDGIGPAQDGYLHYIIYYCISPLRLLASPSGRTTPTMGEAKVLMFGSISHDDRMASQPDC